MVDIALQQKHSYSCVEPMQFQLDADDTYGSRCGEVFITLNRALVFHCSFCDCKYGSSDNLVEHLTIRHSDKIFDEFAPLDVGSEEESKTWFPEYDFTELTREAEDDNYEELLAVGDFIEDDLKPEKIEEEYLDETEEVNHVDDTLHDCEELQTVEKVKKGKKPLAKHQASSWPSSPRKKTKTLEVFSCDKCARNFESKRKLNKHYVTHSSERKHKCKICGFAFKERSNLNAHVRRHTGKKTVPCNMCPKLFFTRTEADTHMRSHTGERPYVCSSCGMAFTTSGGLNEHVKRHNNVRPHLCVYCDKRFYDSCQLKDHIPVHTNERPFVCTICSANFARNKALRVHMKLHINAKEYQCHLCERSFNQRPALVAHVKINHKVVEARRINEFTYDEMTKLNQDNGQEK